MLRVRCSNRKRTSLSRVDAAPAARKQARTREQPIVSTPDITTYLSSDQKGGNQVATSVAIKLPPVRPDQVQEFSRRMAHNYMCHMMNNQTCRMHVTQLYKMYKHLRQLKRQMILVIM